MRTLVADNPRDVAAAAARFIQLRAAAAIRLRDRFRLAVSGGSTPSLMFDALAALALDWGRVELFQVDERIAPDGHVDRNATQLTERLLHRVPLLRHNIHLMGVTSKDHCRAAIRYEAALGAVPLDVVHLGLGDDGHTASWPPGDPVVESARAVAISCEYRGRSRMTLTPVAVNAGRARLMVVCGEDKATALADWLRGRGDPPVRYLHRTRTTLMVDRAAASQLTRG